MADSATHVQSFSAEGDFQAYHAACRWLDERGISHGRMQGGAPIGLLAGRFDIAKWRNLNAAERHQLDGTMTGDFRCGPVVVRIRCAALRRAASLSEAQ